MKIITLPEDWTKVTVLVTDFDRTFTHPEAKYYSLSEEREKVEIAKALGLTLDQANATVAQRRKELSKGQERATLTETLLTLGLTSKWWNEVREKVCYLPETELSIDPDILSQFNRITARFPKVVVASNSPQGLVDRALRTIGCRNETHLVWGAESGGDAKHHPNYFLRISQHLGVDPSVCVAMGDRQSTDCDSPLAVGYAGAFWLDRNATDLVGDLAKIADLVEVNV